MSAVRVLPVTSMVRALRVMSLVVAMLMWVLQVVWSGGAAGTVPT